MSVKILAISGSTRAESRTRQLVEIAAEAARVAGAEVRRASLRELALPVFISGDKTQAETSGVKQARSDALWADGFILGTPEYHGGISGALKNWLDFLYEELAGKLCGVVAATGGGGGDMSITATKRSFEWCHGFSLPFHAAARGADFTDGKLNNDQVRDRIRRLAFDVVRYAPILRDAFEEARKLGDGERAGFAGFHAQ